MDTLKFDGGKARLALVPPKAIKAIGEVMTYGLTKYEEDSWKDVEPWRYRDALMRHLCAYLQDPTSVDEESGLTHLWHLTTNAAFLCELESSNARKEYEDIGKAMAKGLVTGINLGKRLHGRAESHESGGV